MVHRRHVSGELGDVDGGRLNPLIERAALRTALYLRAVAIRQARERQLNGFVLTSNGTRADLDRLVRDTGAGRVTVSR